MNTQYPHHHTQLHEMAVKAARPICAYCLHLLGVAGVPLSASMKRALEDDHDCVEKISARRPDVALPYN